MRFFIEIIIYSSALSCMACDSAGWSKYPVAENEPKNSLIVLTPQYNPLKCTYIEDPVWVPQQHDAIMTCHIT